MNFLKLQRHQLPKNVFTVFEEPVRSEMFSAAHLERHGQSLARAQEVSPEISRGVNLTARIAENERVLTAAYKSIIETVREQRAITPAAEWLIDNFYIVEEQIRDIRDHLPPSYYRELPKLSSGHLKGYPRVYGIAWAFIAHTDSLFDPDLLKHFVMSYQKVQPLTIGELWAISITLRLVMIENLRRLSARIVGSQDARKSADIIADELLGLSGVSNRPTDEILNSLNNIPFSGAFAVQLVQRLRFQESAIAPMSKWLDERLVSEGFVVEKIVTEEHNSQISANATVRNTITSMRLMSAFDWRVFFEEISLVDEILREHPSYSDMDFITRDRYRHGLEELARGSKIPEVDVARAVLNKTRSIREVLITQNKPVEEKLTDLGFYLISHGRESFEKELGFKVKIFRHFLRWYVSHGQVIYTASVFTLSAIILLLCLKSAGHLPQSWEVLTLLGIFGAFPASELALTTINRLTVALLGPRHLPRLKLPRGVPPELKTFVVVPTFLDKESFIPAQVEQLEVHYLSNPDGALNFALLSDWRDSDSEHMSNDQRLYETAREKINLLNEKYGPGLDGKRRFFLLHRYRKWNPSENKWIGWERKRGKLHEFNRLMRGAKDTSFIINKDLESQLPTDVKYVITLDADTKIPRRSVAQLVGTLAHPLNHAKFDLKRNRVVEGYGILQPRITASLPSTQDSTLFQRVSSGPCGIDPYASAISDVYQDLFAEGSYTGKGIYDIDVFERALKDRTPENRLLSHDLFEGNFARCGLLSDVEFFEDFPSHSEVAQSRVHRWTRGDWQLLPWILGKAGLDISLLGRWKMLDNLRRSLVAPMTLFLFLTVFSTPGLEVAPWLTLIIVSLGLSPLLPFLFEIISYKKKISLKRHLRFVSGDLALGLGRFVLNIVFLPYHSWIFIDAISRTLIRMVVTKRHLLEWTTAAQAKFAASLKLISFLKRMLYIELLLVLIGFLILEFNPSQFGSALPLICLWLSCPVLAWLISIPPSQEEVEPLDDADILILRNTARRTWRFFAVFVTAQEKFLPPDNFQEDPEPIVAHRSSPTNFGLYLLSVVAARDFGWIGVQEMVERLDQTLESMKALPRYHGHFFNWYETTDGRALEPRYISSVDNGNLAGHLIALAQACEETLKSPIFSQNVFTGTQDALRLLRLSLSPSDNPEILATIEELNGVLSTPLQEISNRFDHWEVLSSKTVALVELTKKWALGKGPIKNEILSLAKMVEEEIKSHVQDFHLLTPWAAFSIEESRKLDSLPLNRLSAFCNTKISELVRLEKEGKTQESPSAPFYSETLLEALETSSATASALTNKLKELAVTCRNLFKEMDFNFLFEPKRKLFSIGYRMTDSSLDDSFYDLLASEARLLSYIAIAKGDIPVAHWFRLGRALVPVEKGAALISWSGSMFEYLMPSLVMATPASSLLEQTCRLVVRKQISYAEEREVPWGISESALNTRNVHLTYQYSNFGIPELALKRGLERDLVISPYSSILAAMYEPVNAVKNLKRLTTMGAEGPFGFYEAIDFTKARLPDDQEYSIVKSYMAHHHGMSLISIANVLGENRFQKRFHLEAIVQASELLLQERTPRYIAVADQRLETVEVGALLEGPEPSTRRYHGAMQTVPRTHILSHGQYAVMITAAGSGYSRFKEISVTRWREDATRDNWGSFIFLRDVESGKIWSAGFQPTCTEPDVYDVVFSEDRAKIKREDGNIISHLEIILSPEDDAEIRRLSLTNTGQEVREIEVTSYAEVVLNSQGADIAHPTFSNLFVQTEYIPEHAALIATRRPRSQGEPVMWMAHVLANDSNAFGDVEYETDRAQFIGRGRNIANPAAIYNRKPLSNTVGAVLDPIVSLRRKVRIPAGATAHIIISTILTSERDEAIKLADKFHDASLFDRVSNLAWTQAQVKLHFLGIEPAEANLFQQLANRLLYLDSSLRPSSDVLKNNVRDVTGLWAYGISGDYPIVLVRIDDIENRSIVRQLLRAHEYWGTKRLNVDLVILNEKSSSYSQELHDSLETMVRGISQTSESYLPHSKGKVFVLRADLLPQQDRDLLQTGARATLVARQGTLAEQVKRMRSKTGRAAVSKHPLLSRSESANRPTPLEHLEFFNGIGGFTDQGREYVICLRRGDNTPAPWVNVIANPNFGFHISERGAGSTWSMNSRENQLTPWSNDPVCDPSGECLYIFDNDSSQTWSPTASPIRNEKGEYIIRHGQGYSIFEHFNHGIQSTLTQFVHVSEPVKISKLVLKNLSKRRRHLSITSYVEWVLGFTRTVSAPYIVTELDESTGALLAHNPWNSEFGTKISFVTFLGGQNSFTCDRAEFLGRNSGTDRPVGLFQTEGFSGKTGAGMDPCSALRKNIVLEPNQEIVVTLFLGQTESREKARELIQKMADTSTDSVLIEVKNSWEEILTKIQVETPDASMNLMLNRWLLYQTTVCRLFARSAFYQAGGAFGFRDQLQDSMALIWSRPEMTRKQILLAASRQFLEGDVQHWWHIPAGRGVRTHCSDDLLWLPYVVSYYLNLTKDFSILDEPISFLKGPLLTPEQEDSYYTPEVTTETASLYDHCVRAMEHSLKFGDHGLPLIGSGDWNDGMNRVGHSGKGESVWLAWFLYSNLIQFSKVADLRKDIEHSEIWGREAARLKTAIETTAWDGAWYRRAYFDNGAPLGSAESTECRIDSIAQSWGVISKAADQERITQAMESVREWLVKKNDQLVLLFTPPFDKTKEDPGYIKGYLPGVRENGGQYSHAAIWCVLAYAGLGDGASAVDLFALLNPINHSFDPVSRLRYKVEPYVIAADVYSEIPYSGRGGWTWYTGSAAWMYRAGIESILGFNLSGNTLQLEPHIHPQWKSFKIKYRHGKSTYEIEVRNPKSISTGRLTIELVDDGAYHTVVVDLE